MIKRLTLTTAFLLTLVYSVWAVPVCTISGVVYDAAGNPLPNAVITFNTLFTQVVTSNTINQTLLSTTTDVSGNLTPITLAQGVYVQITVNGGAPVTAIVPFSSTASFSALISNIVANPSLTELDLIGQITAPTCQAGNGVIYYDSVTNRFMIDANCGGFEPIVTPSSTDTLTNKSLSFDQLTGIPDCQDAGGNHLNYTLSTKTVSCGTTSSGGGGGGSNPQSDATAILFNQADNTKLMKFDLSGLTTATTRTFGVPDRNATMATTSGVLTSGNVAKFDASGNLVDGGAVPGGKYGLSGRSASAMPNASVSYIPINGLETPASGVNSVIMSLPGNGTVSVQNMHCFVTNTPTGGSYTFNLYPVVVSPASPFCTITDPATSCDDVTHASTLTGGSLVAIQVTPASAPTARSGGCSFEVIPQ